MGTSMDCTRVLDAVTVGKLGSGPSCQFLTPSVLTITLGSQATILPNGTGQPDVISLAQNTVGSAAGVLTPFPDAPTTYSLVSGEQIRHILSTETVQPCLKARGTAQANLKGCRLGRRHLHTLLTILETVL